MSEKQRQSLKLLEPRSFDACKNAAAPMMVILGYLEIDTKVSDVDIKTAESGDCREVSKNDGNANGILAAM